MVTIPNRDYRFKRMMDKVVLSCAPPDACQNVGIVCLAGEKKTVYNKIVNYTSTNPRHMAGRHPDYIGTFNGTILIFRDTDSSISLLSEPEDFHGRTFESIYVVSDALKITGPTKHCLASAILNAKTRVNLGNPETYNWK